MIGDGTIDIHKKGPYLKWKYETSIRSDAKDKYAPVQSKNYLYVISHSKQIKIWDLTNYQLVFTV